MEITLRKCPRCGHENVARAIFCFQCGQNLDDPPVVRGARKTGKLVDDAIKFADSSGQESMAQSLKEAKMKMPPDDLNGEPLVCLRCGTFNRSDASYCVSCGAALAVPDDDFKLLARSSARTNVGQVRTNNEDNVSTWALDGVILALVADGLGGEAAGEVASRLAVEAIQADFLGANRTADLQLLSENELSQRLADAIHDANQAVFDRSMNDPQLKGMGTTSTMSLVRGNRAIIVHVGDSRAYLVDGQEGWINQVTSDHTFSQALLATGHITPEQAAVHPMGHVLYRALGQSLDLEVDVYTRYLKANDRLIMCSDGLTRHLKPADIARIVLEAKTPEEATQNLIDLTNTRGGEDNISAIVIQMFET